MGVERERSRQPDRRGGGVNAGGQCLTSKVEDDRRRRPLAGGLVIGRYQIRLGLLGDRVATVIHAVYRQRRGSADRRGRVRPDVSGYRRRPGVGDRGTRQDGEAVGRCERDRCCRRFGPSWEHRRQQERQEGEKGQSDRRLHAESAPL